MYINVTSLPTTATAPMEVSIQNRGNTVLGSVQVNVEFNGQPTTQTFTEMKPNEVRAVTVDLPVAQLLSTGVQVNAQASSNPPSDNLREGVKSRLVQLVSSSPSAGTGN